MSAPCACFRLWPDDEEGRVPESLGQQAQAPNSLVCPKCRQATDGVVRQRAAVRGGFQSPATAPPLSESLIARIVRAMKRAAGEKP
mgnify:CR=1 FL=1